MKPGAGKEARMTPVAMKAEYLDQDIIEFKNNPFIESLPPLSDFRKLGAQLTVRPPHSNAERFLLDEVRLMLTQRIVQFHQPSDIDIVMQAATMRTPTALPSSECQALARPSQWNAFFPYTRR